MDYTILTIIIILATVGIFAIGRKIYGRAVIIADQIKIKRKRIADIDTIRNLIQLHTEKLKRMQKTLTKVYDTSNNFNRDMDSYHAAINKDITERMLITTSAIASRFAKLEKNTPPKKMADVLKNFEDICTNQNKIAYAPYAERIAIIEERQKEYDTSLYVQSKQLLDIQNKLKADAKKSSG